MSAAERSILAGEEEIERLKAELAEANAKIAEINADRAYLRSTSRAKDRMLEAVTDIHHQMAHSGSREWTQCDSVLCRGAKAAINHELGVVRL